MCMEKAKQGANSPQAVASFFLPLLLHLTMGMCMSLTCAGMPPVWVCGCLWMAHLGCRADPG